MNSVHFSPVKPHGHIQTLLQSNLIQNIHTRKVKFAVSFNPYQSKIVHPRKLSQLCLTKQALGDSREKSLHFNRKEPPAELVCTNCAISIKHERCHNVGKNHKNNMT